MAMEERRQVSQSELFNATTRGPCNGLTKLISRRPIRDVFLLLSSIVRSCCIRLLAPSG